MRKSNDERKKPPVSAWMQKLAVMFCADRSDAGFARQTFFR
jgi:hypothetical protein